MTNKRQEIGKWGENLAAAYLEENGYRVLEQNIFTPRGEIDILALLEEDGEKYLVFVEVKTRTSQEFGNPEDAITRLKQEHLVAAIEYYLNENSELDFSWQIDVIAIQKLSVNEPPDIRHFESVFS